MDHPDRPVFTPARGQRLHWNELPDQVQRGLEDLLGASVVWASRGAAWIDLLFMLPSVAMQCGPQPWEIFDTHPLARGIPDDRVTALVAVITGFLIWQSRQPSPPGLPTIRAFQRDQGLPSLEWLKRRTGWT